MVWCSGRRLATRTRLHRLYSTSPAPYAGFQKLRVYPFAFNKEAAISYFGIFAAGLCQEKLLSSTIGRFFPEILQPIQPKRIVPLYFPAWVVDAEVEAKAHQRDVEKRLTVQLQDGYLPGSSFQVLSSVPLWSSALGSVNEPQPWSEDLRNQFDEEINCVPFNIDPLASPKALSGWNPEISSTLSCSLDNLKISFSVFRPILIPIYMAQYETKNETDPKARVCTLFMDALSSSSPVRAYRFPTSFTDDYDAGIDELSKTFGFYTSPDLFCFGPDPSYGEIGVRLAPSHLITAGLGKSLDAKMRDPETMQIMEAASSAVLVSDGDPRIREFDVEDRNKVERWMEESSKLTMVEVLLDAFSKKHESGMPTSTNELQIHIQGLEKAAEETRLAKDELEPEWWTEYTLSGKEKNETNL